MNSHWEWPFLNSFFFFAASSIATITALNDVFYASVDLSITGSVYGFPIMKEEEFAYLQPLLHLLVLIWLPLVMVTFIILNDGKKS